MFCFPPPLLHATCSSLNHPLPPWILSFTRPPHQKKKTTLFFPFLHVPRVFTYLTAAYSLSFPPAAAAAAHLLRQTSMAKL